MEDGSDDNMEEIIVIRAVDPDENVFQAITFAGAGFTHNSNELPRPHSQIKNV